MLKAATEQLATIAGQQPSVRRARKSIAAFKLREGMPVGVAVTLRGERGYEFLDRLDLDRDPAHPRLPRAEPALVRRPRQLLDGRQEQIIFPEIDYDAIDQVRGLDITITTSAAATSRPTRCSPASACRSPRRAGPRALTPRPTRRPSRLTEAEEKAGRQPPRPRAARRRRSPKQTRTKAAGRSEAAAGAASATSEPRPRRAGAERGRGRAEASRRQSPRRSSPRPRPRPRRRRRPRRRGES